ncbi:SagB/ThcOx family dehydrogenase [Bacillus sp. IBL03825]|uniref:SagB/ThcOx family dehydrogenase n=1 Tax=Bacillus sp. IBL03825 TaxID=2953580 RepID=UPI00215852DA|nr:SagB/ThcOx family dehydrogenase [Bacillus sp. IBL03825]MCR6850383.1 SagB/ThcOx family dehydrogenase [Bacillus sp. IBL03825]
MSSPLDKNEPIPHDYGWAAATFHRISSFGYFKEPLPPFSLAPEETYTNTELNVDKIRSEFPSNSICHTLGGLLIDRLSCREFGTDPLFKKELIFLMWSAYGKVNTLYRHTVPSAGAIYPLRLILLSLSVKGLEPGFYTYETHTGKLKTSNIPLPSPVSSWFRTKHVNYEKTAAIIFMIGNLSRICPKYGERGYRYLLLEAGHSAQNLCLASTALGIPHLPVGGFDDQVVNNALCSSNDREVVVYSFVLGKK